MDIVSGRLRNFHLVLAPTNPNPRSVASDCDMRVARCRWRDAGGATDWPLLVFFTSISKTVKSDREKRTHLCCCKSRPQGFSKKKKDRLKPSFRVTGRSFSKTGKPGRTGKTF